jgi:hypothetical protein
LLSLLGGLLFARPTLAALFRQSDDESQEAAGCRSKTANRFAAAATACLGLWRRRPFDEGLNECPELLLQRVG